MAKQTILRERGTGEVMYPQTLASLVQTAGGVNVDKAIEKAKFALFVDMWCKAVGKFGTYNAETGFFELNGLTDILYEEALKIFDFFLKAQYYLSNYSNPSSSTPYTKLRTCIPFREDGACNLRGLFLNIETLVFNTHYPDGLHVLNLRQAFTDVKRILTPLVVNGIIKTRTEGFYIAFGRELEYILLKGLNIDLPIGVCPKIELYCFQYMIANAANTDVINIYVHPDVYAKLTGDMTNEEAAALTPEELTQWQQLVPDALAKNIYFVTV